MKAENKTWAQIIEVLGRNKGVLQSRFKQIQKNDGEGDAGAAKKDEGQKESNPKGDKGGEGKQGKQKKKEKSEEKKEAPKPPSKAPSHKPPVKAPSKAPSNKAGNGEARFTMGEWMTLQEDDLFSFGELQCLSELIMRDEQLRWLRIASAFGDKTGRRVHPEDIREKFEEMGRMG
ncbi:hypothetical protein BDY17DRAFT_295406 [Neohortaea acidophila]|uniref:Myb-like domain-containing protein n=1 Tax=Neohortaea acidophila TaxID=245834 RepID=A0A6A6PX39_9PEZI|nr:uncharacterized protein BDY17DRAFT_295406 [Neohortaea acidophila]KAF2484321.1 hypothetical protein BDY17DRAFT_295406 [Neohortaea acidophila]